jgi:tripartite-type tricarboxylate transporter receptor subunit TctC
MQGLRWPCPIDKRVSAMTTLFSRRYFLGQSFAAAAVSTSLLPQAWAAGYPSKPVRIIVPFAAGAGTDAMGRLMAQKLGEVMSVAFVVENRTGASGAIGAQHVAQSAPDGHTLLLAAAPFTTVPAVVPQAGYDPLRSFVPISMIANGPLLWACNKDLPVNNLRELVAYARTRPGQLNYGSAGLGGINHLVLEMLKARSGTFITHIPYRGIAPANVDMMAGQIHLVTGTIPALAPFVRDGRVKALAVSTQRRSAALPDVPSMAESGFADFDVLNYFGLMAPSGTPAVVVDRIHEALAQVVRMPDVLARFKLDAIEPAVQGPQALGRFLAQDLSGWQKVVLAQNIKVDA